MNIQTGYGLDYFLKFKTVFEQDPMPIFYDGYVVNNINQPVTIGVVEDHTTGSILTTAN